MALKRKVIGSFCKSKDPTKAPYIKINSKDVVTLKSGSYLSMESKKYQLEKLAQSEAAGKLTPELVAKIREKLEKMPDWVMADVVQLEEVN